MIIVSTARTISLKCPQGRVEALNLFFQLAVVRGEALSVLLVTVRDSP
jgi:hypothetical protein